MITELLVVTWSVPCLHLSEGSSAHGIVSPKCACNLKLVPCQTMVVMTRTYVRSIKTSPTVTHLPPEKHAVSRNNAKGEHAPMYT